MNILIGTFLLWALALAMLSRLRRTAPDTVAELRARAFSTMAFMVPRLVVGLIGAGFMAELLPVGRIEQMFGESAGLSGIGLASVFGALTPGGPFVAFAIGAAALKAGAGWAALMAYVTAWSVMNLNRSIAYELPLMGRRFLLLRSAISLPLPLLLGVVMLLA